MKRLLLIVSLCLGGIGAEPLYAAPGCPKVNPAIKAPDGIPLCPDAVKQKSGWEVFRCAMQDQRSWHPPTKKEIDSSQDMLRAFAARDYKKMLEKADGFRAQVCRVIDGDDKYVLVFAKYGVKDYNSPILMLRDAAKVSKLAILTPHVLTDGYSDHGPLAFKKNHILALWQNGHKKGIADRASDFSHSETTVGHHMYRVFGQLYPKTALGHFHGMKDPDSVLVRSRHKPMQNVFERVVKDLTGIKDYRAFNAYYSLEKVINTGKYLKTELPTRLYSNRDMIISQIVEAWEKEPWAWDDSPEPSASPEPDEVIPDDGAAEDEHDSPEAEDTMDDEGDSVDEEEAAPAPEISASPAPAISWKPRQLPNLGSQDLICVAVKYTSGASADVGKCLSTAKGVANFYDRMSSGKKKLIAKAIEFPFAGPASQANASKVHAIIRKKYPKALFIVPNVFAHSSSHAGMRVAVLNNASYANGNHEVGHLLGLQHCGAWKIDPKTGKEHYDDYAGGGCIMSRFFGNAYLAPNQFIYEGWYSKDQYAIKTTREPQEYELRPIANLKVPGLAAIAIAPELLGQARPGYIALPPNCSNKDNTQCVAYYLGNAGSSPKGWEASARVAMFGSAFTDKSGLRITVISRAGGKVKLKVDFAP